MSLVIIGKVLLLSKKLSCGSAGNTYPTDAIDQFIDDNKALIRRMYGELQVVIKYHVKMYQSSLKITGTKNKNKSCQNIQTRKKVNFQIFHKRHDFYLK